MENLQIILQIIEITIFTYLAFAGIYILIFAIAGRFKQKNKKSNLQEYRKFAVLIPGYKEDKVIVEVAKKALEQSYPQNLYDVVIIADSFKATTIKQLKNLPIKLVEVSFKQSTKSKALNKAMNVIGDNYEVALILDADNVMEYDFIRKINTAFNSKFKVVQGHRVAKNTNTNFAVLDAISEEINNSIFRKGHRVIGLSSALIGSGMAFQYSLFKNMMKNVNAVGGFDKELELKLLKNKIKIEYIENALVYDEKVSKSKIFAKQRKRWLSAQFVYFKKFFLQSLYHLFFKGNIDFFDKVYQMVSPPRILLLGIVTFLTILSLLLTIFIPDIISNILIFNILHWIALLIVVISAIMLAIPNKYLNIKTLKAIITLPKIFIIMFLSLFKLKNANKKFIHTAHG